MRQMRKSLDQREQEAARHRKWNEPRVWQVKCPACEHTGTVFMTLRRLRQVNLRCTACAKGASEAHGQFGSNS